MTATVIRADARALPLPDASVDLVATSPPYFALRSYTDGGEHYAGQIGAEPTPSEYIASLIDCTREWVRVLKPGGSIWVNLGDKYNSAASGQNGTGATTLDPNRGPKMYGGERGSTAAGIRPKSLLLLPERYRIACVDQLGLIARAVVIWAKPNGLPESVTDRVRRSHEDWVHLTKQPRYFSAVDEVRERYAPGTAERYAKGYTRTDYQTGQVRKGIGVDYSGTFDTNPLGKLPGSVWEIATEPLTVPDHLGVDHFAAFPTEWPRRIILGWSPSGICVGCGEGRRPVHDGSEKYLHRPGGASRVGNTDWQQDGAQAITGKSRHDVGNVRTVHRIVGEACACSDPTAPTRPAVVLDPFGGTGTAALVAKALGRHGISVDRSADYCRLAQWRTTDPGQLAKAMRVEKPPVQMVGQMDLLDLDGAA